MIALSDGDVFIAGIDHVVASDVQMNYEIIP